MTKYREIIRLAGLGLSQTNIALSCNASKTTVNKVLKAAREQNLTWPLDPKLTVQIAAYYGRFCGAKRPQCGAERPVFLLI